LKYQFGLLTSFMTANRVRRVVGVCSCGQRNLLPNNCLIHDAKCEKCGNKQFFQPDKSGKNGRQIIPYINVMEKSHRGFTLERINLSITYDSDYNITVLKENTRYLIGYDMVDKKLNVTKFNPKGDSEHFSDRRRALTKVDDRTLVNLISVDDNNFELYEYARSYLSGKRLTNYGWRTTWQYNFFYALEGLWDLPHLQILSNAGFKNVSRFKNSGYSYANKNHTLDLTGTSPAKILKLPKFLVQRIKDDKSIDSNDVVKMQKLLEKIDGNKLREMVEIADDESSLENLINCADTVMEIYTNYDYKNLKKLLLYLVRDTRINQGISSPSTASTLLRDYLRMMKDMSLHAEKYPKSLKKDHDIATMNYKSLLDNHKKELFAKTVVQEEYTAFEYHGERYSVIKPLGTDDLVNEGTQLSHCVASYINDVCFKRCQILFMRDAESLNKPLVTIEVRNGKVRQARGQSNRGLTMEESEFLNEWAKEKEILVKTY